MLTHPSKRFVRVQIHVTGTFTVPLLHRSRSGIHGYTFRMILLAPLISAFIRMPFLLLNPRLILFPEGVCYRFHRLVDPRQWNPAFDCVASSQTTPVPAASRVVFDHFDRMKRYLNKCRLFFFPIWIRSSTA